MAAHRHDSEPHCPYQPCGSNCVCQEGTSLAAKHLVGGHPRWPNENGTGGFKQSPCRIGGGPRPPIPAFSLPSFFFAPFLSAIGNGLPHGFSDPRRVSVFLTPPCRGGRPGRASLLAEKPEQAESYKAGPARRPRFFGLCLFSATLAIRPSGDASHRHVRSPKHVGSSKATLRQAGPVSTHRGREKSGKL